MDLMQVCEISRRKVTLYNWWELLEGIIKNKILLLQKNKVLE